MRKIVLGLPALALPLLLAVPFTSASAQVPGSYRQSCRNVYQTGPMLSADCRGNNGLTHSTLDLNRCRGQGVFNAFGRLACGSVQGSAEPVDQRRGGDYGGQAPGYDRGYDGPPRPRYRQPQQDDDDDGYAPPPRPRYAPY